MTGGVMGSNQTEAIRKLRNHKVEKDGTSNNKMKIL